MKARLNAPLPASTLEDILEPLAEFALSIGLSARDLQKLCRVAVVLCVAKRQTINGHRVNMSGIAAATGVPRGEVSRILKLGGGKKEKGDAGWPHSINKIASAWSDDPKYLTVNGRPIVLPIYGRGRTFEELVRRHGKGLPVRALLDEFLRSGLGTMVGSQKVRLKSSISVSSGLGTRETESLGRKVGQLIRGMTERMMGAEHQLILSTIEGEIPSLAVLPILRKEFVSGSEDLLSEFRESLFRLESSSPRSNHPAERGKIRVSMIYQEELSGSKPKAADKRKNFRRSASA